MLEKNWITSYASIAYDFISNTCKEYNIYSLCSISHETS
jgi:hypothetical protein